MQYFRPVHYDTCSGDPWSVISDVTTGIVSGHHELCPHSTVNLMDQCHVCPDCSTDRPVPCLCPCPRLGPAYPLTHRNIEIRSRNNPSMVTKCSSEGRVIVSHFSAEGTSKAEMAKSQARVPTVSPVAKAKFLKETEGASPVNT